MSTGDREYDDFEIVGPDQEVCRLAEKMRNFSTVSEQGSSPTVYKLPITVVSHDQVLKLRVCEIGERSFLPPPEKIVIMLGATGSGKTTIINGMANYIFGVNWKDDFRFKVITSQDEGTDSMHNQAFSQTKYISSYTFHHQEGFPMPYTVTLIDTPGFGDTEGIQKDEEIVRQIRALFERRGNLGIEHLDAIGFVVPAPNARLTQTQQYILDSILSIFGKDAIENIFILGTFADGGKPQVLNAIKAANLNYKEFFKFNNSALFSENTDDEDEENFDHMFWKIGIKSYKAFFTALNTVTSKSLQMTREVLEERQKLETSIAGVQKLIALGLAKLDTLKQESEVIRQFERDIETNKNFTYEIDVTKQRKVDLEPGEYITNCLTCNFTCHYPCSIPNDEEKQNCLAINSNGNCDVCPGRCIWSSHVNNTYRFEIYVEKETRTSEELRNRYLSATTNKSNKENMLTNLGAEFENIERGIEAAITTARNSINKLNEIAAKSHPLSTVDYIELLIKSEEMAGKPGFQQRIHHLQEAKKKAELLDTIQDPNYDPWEEYAASNEQKPGKKSWWKFWN